MSTPDSLWRHADFRRLWAAESVSQLGTQVSLIALPLMAIIALHATPFQVGLLTAVEFLPFLLVGLPAGAWVDRMRRRPVLIAADLGRAAALLILPAAYLLDLLQLWMLFPVVFLVGVLTVFFDVAYGSYLPSLVDRDQLVDGNAKLELSRTGAQIVGPGLGAGLVQVLTAPVAVLADALSFLGSALFLIAVKRREQPPVVPEGGHRLLAEIGEGLRFVISHPLLRPIALTTATLNLALGANQAVLLVFAVRDLGLSPVWIGAVVIAGNIGGLLGAVLSGRLAPRLGYGPTIVVSVTVFATTSVLFPLAYGRAGAFLVAAGLFAAGVSAVVYNIAQISLRQTVTPDRLLGRMNSSMRFVVWGIIPLGAVAGGVAASQVGSRAVLWAAFAVGLVAIAPPTLSALRSVRDVSAPDEELATVGGQP
ncbi:MFS family permease [Allocatelliglobosispora scoriae]|uniref:MFS family permease n=2 Tax=Allocatelliglobosispora scoriae TaxID=643052 RepID=A0A841BKW2_9ACTN|nr:MFS family permease [Allocatelliglobosispora scoriae]